MSYMYTSYQHVRTYIFLTFYMDNKDKFDLKD